MELQSLREEVVEIGRRMWQRGYVAANDGNISVRVSGGLVLTTPTGVSKGFMKPEHLVLTDFLSGQVVAGDRKPSSELKMHLEIYRQRPEIRAVVHAHPPISTAFAVAGIPLDLPVLTESVLILGSVPLVPYGTPSTDELVANLRPHVTTGCAALLANHGAVTWAESLLDAYFQLETLEHTATILKNGSELGDLNLLPPAEVRKLLELREKMEAARREAESSRAA